MFAANKMFRVLVAQGKRRIYFIYCRLPADNDTPVSVIIEFGILLFSLLKYHHCFCFTVGSATVRLYFVLLLFLVIFVALS